MIAIVSLLFLYASYIKKIVMGTGGTFYLFYRCRAGRRPHNPTSTQRPCPAVHESPRTVAGGIPLEFEIQ